MRTKVICEYGERMSLIEVEYRFLAHMANMLDLSISYDSEKLYFRKVVDGHEVGERIEVEYRRLE